MTLDSMLRTARAAKGWSLSEAAAHLNITKSHLHDLERGRSRNPTLYTVRYICTVYGIKPDKIVNLRAK